MVAVYYNLELEAAYFNGKVGAYDNLELEAAYCNSKVVA